MINSNKKPEILAPCGSYDIMIAAIKAGADACYFGGNKFGARAYATNFDTDSVIKAIQYAHIHEARLYLTVNTLFRDEEINELYEYLLPFYEAGLDAVIVQDLGVFKYVKTMFPDLPIHCSTQMNITSIHGALMMKEQGASRIVTAREMSLQEIKTIKETVDIEIESFVHGAMCYSYSGRCLMSSLAGGRSGNRGRCAQPCRKAYDGDYILSMKDMCTLSNIPEIINAGIDSLKIEGRMKNEYYVASAVAAYRELVDDYYQGQFRDEKAQQLQFKLANVYNRGGFCGGYYNMHNGLEMLSKERPNNQGVTIGRITGINNGQLVMKLYENLYKQDVIEVMLKDKTVVEITSGIEGDKGATVELKAPKTKQILIGKNALRTRCNKILEKIDSDIINSNIKYEISGRLEAKIGEPICLTLYRNLEGKIFEASVFGGIVEKSQKQSPNESLIKEKLCQLGQTDYIMCNLDICCDSMSFVPTGVLKALRREAIVSLEKVITDNYKRKVCAKENMEIPNKDKKQDYSIKINVGVSNISQLESAIKNNVDAIYLYRELYNEAEKMSYIDLAVKQGIKLYIQLPEIVKNDFDFDAYLPNENINGIYINNIDGYASLINFMEKNSDSVFVSQIQSDTFDIVLGIYGYNHSAREFLLSKLKNVVFELPHELNKEQLMMLGDCDNNELIVYEHQRVMLSAQCVVKNKKGCNHNSDFVKITDDRGNDFYCQARCSECCNIIFNGKPLMLMGYIDKSLINQLGLRAIRLNFTYENEEKIDKILAMARQIRHHGSVAEELKVNEMSYTTGHFRRGVE